MASRSSSNFNSEFYTTTWRGRELANGMGWEMFPEKISHTPIEEDPERLNMDRRMTLMDFTPDTSSMFAYEEPRRNVMSRSHLNLRDGGIFGSTTDPYANSGGAGYGGASAGYGGGGASEDGTATDAGD